MKIFPRCLLFLPLLLSLQSCALTMALWRDESQSPPKLKTETRQTQRPVLKLEKVNLKPEDPRRLSVLIELDQEFEKRELLVFEKTSEPSLWGSTLGLILSLGLVTGGILLDQQTQHKSSQNEIGPWGWGSLILLGADLLASLFWAEPQTQVTTLNESAWKAISASPAKPLYLRKSQLTVNGSDWQSEALTDSDGWAHFNLQHLPSQLFNRSHLQLQLAVLDPVYGTLQTQFSLNENQMDSLRLSFGQLPSHFEPLRNSSLAMSLELIPNNPKKHRGLAIIIGNQDYRLAPASEYALHDAEMVKRYTQNVWGFQPHNTISLANASKAELETVFGNREEPRGQMADWHTPNTPLLIYYSGHGAATLAGKSFLLPVDANPNYLASSGYALETLYQNLAKLNYSELTVIIDACFSGMTPGGPLMPDRKPLVLETQKYHLPPLKKALLIHASNSHEMSVWWKEKKHSLFTFYLLKGLQGEANFNKDQALTVQELQQYLETEVPSQARRLLGANQNPVFWGDLQRTLFYYPPSEPPHKRP